MNQWNIAYGHVYSIIGLFNIKASNGTLIKVIILRNPWGFSAYNLSLNTNDTFWNSFTISQLPFNIYPNLDGANNSIFIVPVFLFSYCFDTFFIGHYRG